MSLIRAPARDSTETPGQRERIRSRMKMVIDQLEGILRELKEVARELREVVGQIDKLTSDFDFELEPDDWTVATVSSTSSSERGLGDTFGRLDFLTSDVLSDSWEFCNFLETPPPTAAEKPAAEAMVSAEQAAYAQMNGGIILNGPLVVTPDSSSEEASTHSHKNSSRTPGTRERVRFSDKILYHALCCDDDEEEPECGPTAETDSEHSQPAASPPPSATQILLNCHAPSSPVGAAAKQVSNSAPRKKLLRNSSTQTVADKSTQTVLPYIPAKQKTKD
ncbi:inhibitory synaptic factor 1-like [Polyodon spathula]|uniref:inhibitory synaptic factor 1-like n=1 Tax=Polyodon spathula TaxID=7913 RepID=UPI001B7F6D5E|nr:inhibitory synaptic factor 1-like [Polyodon spathula]